MAWVKIPLENHPIFLAALPRDHRISTVQMFGGIAAKVNGHMFGGLFACSAMVRLAPKDRDAALALDGAAPFDPMGRGAVMRDSVLLPEAVMDEPAELRDWLVRALRYTASLPPKTEGKPRAKRAATPANRPAARRAAAAKPARKPPRRKTSSKRTSRGSRDD
jgi:TfoX/Sxy family transcriptional regulator of competence genes